MKDISINGDRLWDSLAAMARVGATRHGGVCRLALSDVDKAGRDLFVSWCKDAGCVVSVDEMGNIFARRDGLDAARAAVATGSHLDSQPTGGRFDGAYGVLAGLEVIRTLNDFGRRTQAPLETVVWTNEEGSRFAPAMIASGVFAGVFDLDYGLSRADGAGKTIGEELARIGYDGALPVGQRKFGAFFEAHIEQGPILDESGTSIGIVTGAQAQRWYNVSVMGEEAHAGPTPMERRHDALLGAARAVVEVNRIGLSPAASATVGFMSVAPNSRNTIPGRVSFSVDLRHPDDAMLATMDADLRASLHAIGTELGLTISIDQIWHSPAVIFDSACIGTLREAAAQLGLSQRDIISGAGHDACYINRVAPTGMIFIPCEGGVSHNEAESASKQDVAAGAQVLLLAMLRHAELV
jgi:beta-ureidopropionase / N-carbamoyl-L-amino-acid hydrolase